MDDLVRSFPIGPPLRGLQDGLDPALSDELYPPTYAPLLRNARVGKGQWETRYGISTWRSMPGSGTQQLLTTGYLKDGSRIRVAVRGGSVYKWDEGDNGRSADVAWQTVGSTVLSSTAPRVRCCQAGEALYLVDGVSAPYKYTLGGTGGSVALPTAPTAVTAKARNYGWLETWTGNAGVAPFGWTESQNARFDLIDSNATDPSPQKGSTVQLRIKDTAAKTATITENVSAEKIYSRTIAFWILGNDQEHRPNFEVGVNNAGEQSFSLKVPKKDTWYVKFCDVGLLDTINYKRFRAVRSPDTTGKITVSRLGLPGKLQGRFQWRIAFWNSTTGQESKLSPVSGTLDLSQVGVDYKNETEPAMRKTAALTWAKSVESGVDYVRAYRSGGTKELSVDPATGRQIWLRVGQVKNKETTLNGAVSAAATSIVLTSATDFAQDDWIVIARGTATEEIRRIATLAGTTATLDEPLDFAQSNLATIGICFLDNVANEELDVSNRIDPERDPPPTGATFVDQAPDGGLWMVKWTNRPAGYAVSNHATPERPNDFEVFPDGVDPLTRQDILQGWRGDVAGHAGGQEVQWFGFFNRLPTFLTKTGLWVLRALRQTDYGPNALALVADKVGCISTDGVAIVNGVLYWPTEGNRIARWDGENKPQVLSYPFVSSALEGAPAAYLADWFSVDHSKRDGAYYQLYYTPSGGTTVTDSLQHNTDTGAWEHASWWTNSTTRLVWKLAHVGRQGADTRLLWAVDSSGQIWQIDDPAAVLDGSNPIRTQWKTKRIQMGAVCQLERLFVRLQGVTSDTVSLTVTAGGSEYAESSQTYTFSAAGSTDLDKKVRLHHQTLKGRWFDIRIDGTFSHRPAVREMELQAIPIRANSVTFP